MFGINVTEYDKFIYEEYLRDFLPDRMIDIHVHIWKEGMERAGDESKNRKGMVDWTKLVAPDCSIEDLMKSYEQMFPGKSVKPVLMGWPSCDLEKVNKYAIDCAKSYGLPAFYCTSWDTPAEDIRKAIEGADMIFITTGMGGGTGTGAAPVVAKIAKDMGILTVAIVTKPFNFEGKRRMDQAEKGIAELRKHVDSLVVIPNERLKLVSEQRITLANAFSIADDVLRQGVQSISDLIQIPGIVNLDFEDVKSIMQDAGYAHMGVGRAAGKDKAEQAAVAAISSPLLETAIAGAKGVIINIKSSPDIALDEIDVASQLITERASEDANIIWGAAFDETMEDEMMVTVIATGFDGMNGEKTQKPATPAISDADLFGNPSAPSTGSTTSAKSDDDTFSDIMSIFNRK